MNKSLATLYFVLAALTRLVVGSALQHHPAATTTRSDCSLVTCVPSTGAAHIIVSRASTEAQGPGILISVAEAIIDACPGSDYSFNPCK